MFKHKEIDGSMSVKQLHNQMFINSHIGVLNKLYKAYEVQYSNTRDSISLKRALLQTQNKQGKTLVQVYGDRTARMLANKVITKLMTTRPLRTTVDF